MKKAQLEEEVRVLNERIRKMEEDRKAMLKKTEVALSDQLSTIERNLYDNWKAMNAKFVKMYIKEMLGKGALTIDAKTSEGGYFDIYVEFDGECIASTDGKICMGRFYS
jgi:hypothetical protein